MFAVSSTVRDEQLLIVCTPGSASGRSRVDARADALDGAGELRLPIGVRPSRLAGAPGPLHISGHEHRPADCGRPSTSPHEHRPIVPAKNTSPV